MVDNVEITLSVSSFFFFSVYSQSRERKSRAPVHFVC